MNDIVRPNALNMQSAWLQRTHLEGSAQSNAFVTFNQNLRPFYIGHAFGSVTFATMRGIPRDYCSPCAPRNGTIVHKEFIEPSGRFFRRLPTAFCVYPPRTPHCDRYRFQILTPLLGRIRSFDSRCLFQGSPAPIPCTISKRICSACSNSLPHQPYAVDIYLTLFRVGISLNQRSAPFRVLAGEWQPVSHVTLTVTLHFDSKLDQ